MSMENKYRLSPDDVLVHKVYRVNFFDSKKEWVIPVDILAFNPEEALGKLEDIKIDKYTANVSGLQFSCLLDELPLVLRNKIIQNGFIKYKRER